MSPAEQAGCVDRLVRHLHAQVLANVRADLIQRGERDLPENATLSQLLEGRSFLFDEDNYHVDVSHLSAAVRHSLVVEDPATLRLAAELADYGSQLSPRLRFEGRTPFEQTFEDCGRYVKGLLGIQQEEAIAHFRAKMEAPPEPYLDELESSLPAQALVNLLYRIGRHDEAIDVASERLARLPGAALVCPGIVELCRKGKRLDRLVEIAGQNGDLVTYLSARLVEQPAKPS
jgi:hypothetical protein